MKYEQLKKYVDVVKVCDYSGTIKALDGLLVETDYGLVFANEDDYVVLSDGIVVYSKETVEKENRFIPVKRFYYDQLEESAKPKALRDFLDNVELVSGDDPEEYLMSSAYFQFAEDGTYLELV